MEPDVHSIFDNLTHTGRTASVESPIEASEPGGRRPCPTSGRPERSNNEVKA